MLVLSRKEGQTICLGDGIKVTVVRIDGNRVRLGIEAPRNVRVLRSELAEWADFDFGEPACDEPACSVPLAVAH